jgi:DNA-binding NarL/FixJ family response regulator
MAGTEPAVDNRSVSPGESVEGNLRELSRPELRPETTSPSPLTPRELDVLRLAAEGRSTREIAEVLFLSPGTVKTHFHHIYEKLGACGRASAVAHCLRSGLIE